MDTDPWEAETAAGPPLPRSTGRHPEPGRGMEKTVPTAPDGASRDSDARPQNCGAGRLLWCEAPAGSHPSQWPPAPIRGLSKGAAARRPPLTAAKVHICHFVSSTKSHGCSPRARTRGLSHVPGQGSPAAHRVPAGGLPPPWCPQSTRSGQLSALI